MSWMDSNRLYELVEKLQDQAEEQASRSAILITLNELNTFAHKHFEQEERLLTALRSVELKSRRTLHQRVMDQLVNHTEDYKDSTKPQVSDAFLRFLHTWIQLHSQTSEATPDDCDRN